MADLEAAARRLLEPMLRGEVVELDDSDQLVVARWVVKTVTMLDQASSKHIAPVHRESLMAGGNPRTGTLVWLGRYVGRFSASNHGLRMDLVGAETGRKGKGYSAFLTVAQFAAMVIATDFDEQIAATTEVRVSPETTGYLLQIRPGSREVVRWPPPSTVTDDNLQGFREAFVPLDQRSTTPGDSPN
jgi:hypothetical protein